MSTPTRVKVTERKEPFTSAMVEADGGLTLDHLRALVETADTQGVAGPTRIQFGGLEDTDRLGRCFASVALVEHYGKPVRRRTAKTPEEQA